MPSAASTRAMKPSSSALPGAGREGDFVAVAQGVVAQDLLDLGLEHAAEILVGDLLLFGRIGDFAHQLLACDLRADRLFPLLVETGPELGRYGDALLQGAGHGHGRSHQVAHRAEQEEYQSDAHRRYDVGVAYFTLQSSVVFHGVGLRKSGPRAHPRESAANRRG